MAEMLPLASRCRLNLGSNPTAWLDRSWDLFDQLFPHLPACISRFVLVVIAHATERSTTARLVPAHRRRSSASCAAFDAVPPCTGVKSKTFSIRWLRFS